MEPLTEAGTATQDPVDQALLDHYLEGDDPATFEAIHRRHEANLTAYAKRHLRGEFAADVPDIVQETFTQFHQWRADLTPATHLSALLRQIIQQKCNFCLRKAAAQKRDHHRTCPAYELGSQMDRRNDLARRDREIYVDELLSRLPLKEATALRLVWLEEHTEPSAAEVMGEPVTSVKWWIKDGKRRLRELGEKLDDE
jgi:RNA polymerase sigma-70 factor (ECF subfamily)